MKRAFLLASALILSAGCISASKTDVVDYKNTVFQNGEHIVCKNGEISISRVIRPLFNDNFSTNSGIWKPFQNHEQRLDIQYGERLGTRGLILTKNSKPETDTAFALITMPFEVSEGADFTLTISGRGTVDTSRASGHAGNYENQIVWLDKDGKPLKEMFKFSYSFKSTTVTQNVINGVVPFGAANAVISLGADTPNIVGKNYLNFTGVSFVSEEKGSRLWPTGSFISRPFRIPASKQLSWDADIPAHTSVSVQLSTANDIDGLPGNWSQFFGPEKDINRAFTIQNAHIPDISADQKWIRYKVTLHGTPEKSPSFKSIRIGNISENKWKGVDAEPPQIIRTTPSLVTNPNAPIIFELLDETLVDWRTVSVKMDDKDITSKLKRNGTVLTYAPQAPIEPVQSDFNRLSDWSKTFNNGDRLDILPIPDKENSLRVTRDDVDIDTKFMLKSPYFFVKKGKEYTFSIDERCNLKFEKTPKNMPVNFVWYDERSREIGEPVQFCFENENKSWKTYTFKATAPENAIKGAIILGFDNPNIHDKLFIDFANPKISGEAVTTYDPNLPNFHIFSVKASDIGGNTAVSDSFMLIDKQKQTRNITTIREDGAVLIDNKPFLPIGLYAVWKRDFNNNSFDKAFKDIKLGGFNMVHTYNSARNSDFAEFMDTAAKYGIKLFIASNSGANMKEPLKYLKDVVRERNHPAMLSWYLADDTSGYISPKELRQLHDAIHEIDYAHITCQADGTGHGDRNNYLAYVNSTDCYIPEIYPVRKDLKPEEYVPAVIKAMKKVQTALNANGNPAKTVWPVMQYFQGWNSWHRFPTDDELRVTSYLALIHGGNGIVWYTYGGWGPNHGCNDTPEHWAAICKVATELKALQDVFLTESTENPSKISIQEGPKKDAMGFDSISVLYKKVGSKHFLICANSASSAVKASFTLKGVEACKVWFENRNIHLDNGTFSDTFKPNDVHVYELRKLFK